MRNRMRFWRTIYILIKIDVRVLNFWFECFEGCPRRPKKKNQQLPNSSISLTIDKHFICDEEMTNTNWYKSTNCTTIVYYNLWMIRRIIGSAAVPLMNEVCAWSLGANGSNDGFGSSVKFEKYKVEMCRLGNKHSYCSNSRNWRFWTDFSFWT